MKNAEREKIYELEVKRRRVRAAGGYEPFWKVKQLAEALLDQDTEFRCKDCAGAVKLFRGNTRTLAPAHVEHQQKSDSDYCSGGLHFRMATDGRASRMSAAPVR